MAAVTDGLQMCCCRSQDEIWEEERNTLLRNMIFTGKAQLVCCLRYIEILKIFFAPLSYKAHQFGATYSEFWSYE